MTFTAFFLILSSIILHSSWHFLCKSSGKSSMAFFALFSTSLFFTMLPLALSSGLLFKLPADVLKFAFWGAVSGSVCNVGLMLAYKYSDISLAYPTARALPVFFTLLATSLFGWGKPLSFAAAAGMLIIFAGCVLMAFTNNPGAKTRSQRISALKKGLIGILIGAFGTTGYTIIDSFGIKEIMAFAPDENKFLVTSAYSCVRETTAATLMWICVWIRHTQGKDKGVLRELAVTFRPYLAGVFAGLAYALVLLAMNYVTNVSFVQAFRQLSLPFSAFLGWYFLKEKITPFRWAALATIMVGLFVAVI